MNESGSYAYSGKIYEENSPGMLTAAIIAAVFYFVTALTTVVLRVVGMF